MAPLNLLPSSDRLRRAELLLALVVFGSHAVFWGLAGSSEWIPFENVAELLVRGLMVLFFVTPLLLAGIVLLASMADDLGIGSLLAVGVAFVTVYVVSLSIYTLLFPPERGGVYFGHIFSSMAVVLLVASVFFRRVLNWISHTAWIRFRGVLASSK